MVAAAGVIAPALAGADEDAGSRAARGLAHLDIDIVVVERDLTRHGDYVECKEGLSGRFSFFRGAMHRLSEKRRLRFPPGSARQAERCRGGPLRASSSPPRRLRRPR